MTSCTSPLGTGNDPATWQQAMTVLRLRAKAQDYGYITDNLLAPELVKAQKAEHGEDSWRTNLQKDMLENLPFYFGWLKNCDVRRYGNKTYLSGEAGCYATFIEVENRYLLLDAGQHITSM